MCGGARGVFVDAKEKRRVVARSVVGESRLAHAQRLDVAAQLVERYGLAV